VILSSEELVTSESTNGAVCSEYTSCSSGCSPDEILAERVSGNQETDSAQGKLFSEIEESDSNFVSVLERTAGTILLILTHAYAHKQSRS